MKNKAILFTFACLTAVAGTAQANDDTTPADEGQNEVVVYVENEDPTPDTLACGDSEGDIVDEAEASLKFDIADLFAGCKSCKNKGGKK